MSRTVNGVLTGYGFDGDQLILEGQGSTITATYTWGIGLIRRNGEYPLADGLGTARQTSNGSGAVTATTVTEGFGQTVGGSGSTASPYGYNASSGYRSDGDGATYSAPLQKVGARYYDPEFGCFLTRDTNLAQRPYAYCNSDPINSVDPSGHDDEDDQSAACAADNSGGSGTAGDDPNGTGGDNPDGCGPGNHDPGTAGPSTIDLGGGNTVTIDPNGGVSGTHTSDGNSVTITRSNSGVITGAGQSVIIFGGGLSATGGVNYNFGTGIGSSYGAVNYSSNGFSAGFSSNDGLTLGYKYSSGF